MQAHSIELGDIVHFDPVACGNLFNVELFDEGGDQKMDDYNPGIIFIFIFSESYFSSSYNFFIVYIE